MKQMKTITFPGGDPYEVVDAAARSMADAQAQQITQINQQIQQLNTELIGVTASLENLEGVL